MNTAVAANLVGITGIARRLVQDGALDEAAVRIVKMAAPYAPFPPDIRKDYDIIEITRTWKFERSDRVRAY